MKRAFCLICSFILMTLPGLCMAEAPMQHFLKTGVVDILAESEISAQTLYETERLRASVAIVLQISLYKQNNQSGGSFDSKTMYIGYNGECFYVICAYSETQRAIYELDTEYHMCKYRIDDNADMSQNEMICKELCPDHYCSLSQKEIESAVYALTN